MGLCTLHSAQLQFYGNLYYLKTNLDSKNRLPSPQFSGSQCNKIKISSFLKIVFKILLRHFNAEN